MIQVLKEEEQEDIDQRDWFKETTFVKETEASRYAYKIEKTEAKITKLNEKKQELEDAIVATDAEILATQEEVAAMEAARTADNGAYLQAKAVADRGRVRQRHREELVPEAPADLS